MPFSGTCATSNISMGRKDEREERKRVGKTGWFFCFKPRFNISIEKNCLLRNEDEKDGEWEPGKDTETHQEDVTGNKSSAFISGCLQITMRHGYISAILGVCLRVTASSTTLLFSPSSKYSCKPAPKLCWNRRKCQLADCCWSGKLARVPLRIPLRALSGKQWETH